MLIILLQHYVSCDAINIHLKQRDSPLNWLLGKKEANRKQLQFIPLKTFKKRDSKSREHVPCQTSTGQTPSCSGWKLNHMMDSHAFKSNERKIHKDIPFEQNNPDISIMDSLDKEHCTEREDCCCVEAVNRRKRGILDPPVPPPRPDSSIEVTTQKCGSGENGDPPLVNLPRIDLKLSIPSHSNTRKDMSNLFVNYTKVGVVHNTERPPSCGGIQKSTNSFEDNTLTPPPSYDSAISTPEQHFSLYSISKKAVTPSIT